MNWPAVSSQSLLSESNVTSPSPLTARSEHHRQVGFITRKVGGVTGGLGGARGGGGSISVPLSGTSLLCSGESVFRNTLLFGSKCFRRFSTLTVEMITSFKLNIYPLQKTCTRAACTALAEIVCYFVVVEKRTFHPFLQSPTSPFSRQREKPGMTLRGRAEFQLRELPQFHQVPPTPPSLANPPPLLPVKLKYRLVMLFIASLLYTVLHYD